MGALDSILLATDFRTASQKATDVTIRLAKALHARVTVLHVREEYLTWPVSPFENQDQLTDYLNQQEVALVEFMVHAGPPADLIVRKAREIPAQLIVIGAGEKIRHDQLAVGPIAEMVLEHAEPPVLVVNPYGPELRFERILCPVDHSRVSRRALEDAIQLARTFHGQLIILSVVPEVSWLTAAVETGQLTDAKLEHEAQWIKEFDEFLTTVSLEGVSWVRDVRMGKPAEQIVAAAQEYQADLLAMGATGRTGLVRVLLGSVTRRVLRQLPCSLLLVKDQAAFEQQFLLDWETINRLIAEGDECLSRSAWAEAAGKFRQALALDPYNTAALDGLIHTCEQLGQHETAQRYRHRRDQLRQRS
ncbi:MAG: universal stress protein [Gemmataceae bacterium]|nr:universal stress protein [Gemmata sp.]MDW8197910.1 universal stress protein [Gemmataceae bacterium]